MENFWKIRENFLELSENLLERFFIHTFFSVKNSARLKTCRLSNKWNFLNSDYVTNYLVNAESTVLCKIYTYIVQWKGLIRRSCTIRFKRIPTTRPRRTLLSGLRILAARKCRAAAILDQVCWLLGELLSVVTVTGHC